MPCSQSSTSAALSGDIPILKLNPAFPLSVEHLRKFGCVAWVHMHSTDKRRKGQPMAPTSRKAMFVGYSQNSHAYRFWDPATKSLFERRDATFFEDETFSDEGETQPDLCDDEFPSLQVSHPAAIQTPVRSLISLLTVHLCPLCRLVFHMYFEETSYPSRIDRWSQEVRKRKIHRQTTLPCVFPVLSTQGLSIILLGLRWPDFLLAKQTMKSSNQHFL